MPTPKTDAGAGAPKVIEWLFREFKVKAPVPKMEGDQPDIGNKHVVPKKNGDQVLCQRRTEIK